MATAAIVVCVVMQSDDAIGADAIRQLSRNARDRLS
jgi:hypothetical protein